MGDGPSESQAGDDPATFDDEGVGYGNINTTTEQALANDPSINKNITVQDVQNFRTANTPSFTQQSQNYVDDFSGANIGSLPTSRSTSTAALPSSFPTDFTNDYSDFNFANSIAAQNLRKGAEGAGIPSIIPFSGAINALTGLPSRMTLNALNRGQVPTYNADGQITGTTGQGFGMASPTGSVPGYDAFAPVTPTTNVPIDMGDDGGGNEQTLIRRNPNDPVDEIVEETPPVSDQLATDFLQNPYYLYSGIGNQYQPYGYAQGTLVDLLRTRNLTQPQQQAANLGLFANPGDFV
jgi:hypothetical protein